MATTAAELWIMLRAKDEASKVIKDFGGNTSALMKAAGVAAAAGGAAIAGGLALGVKGAMDLQQQVANISTIKPTINTDAVFSALNQMQTRVPQSAAQLGDALYNVFSSMDVGVDEGLQLVETFARGAVGAATDAQTFGTSVMGVMNAYGLSVKDAEHVSDVFFNTVNRGVVTGQELASSLGPVTQSAKAAGVSLDELGGLIAGVTKEGGPAAQNINNLNNFLQKVTTKDAVAAMRDLGVATIDSAGKFKPVTEVLADLKGRLGKMTEAARANALQAIFPDAQARIGAMTLMSQLDAVNEAIEANKTQTGAASDAYKKMSQTASSQFALAKNTIMSVLTTIGANALPLITPLLVAFSTHLPAAFDAVREKVGALVGLFQGFGATIASALGFITDDGGALGGWNDWLLDIQGVASALQSTLLPIIQSVAGALASFVSEDITPKLEALGSALQSAFATAAPIVADFARNLADVLGPALGTVFGFIGEHKELLAGFAVGLGIVAAAWGVYTVAQLAANVAITANPIGLIVVGVATLTAGLFLLVKNWDEVTAKVPALGTAFEAVKGVTIAAIDTIKTGISEVRTFLEDNWGGIEAGARAAWDRVVEVVRGVIDDIVERASQVVDLVRDNWDRISEAGGRAWSMLQNIVGAVVDSIKELVSGLADWWQENAGRIEDTVRNLFIVLGAVVAAGVIAIAYAWDKLGDPIIEIVTVVFETLKGIISGALQIIGGILQVFFSVLSGDWQGAWDGLKDILEGAWKLIQTAVEGAITLLLAVFTGLGGAILSAIGDLTMLLWNVGWSVVQGMWKGITAKWDEMVEGIKGLASKLPDPIKKVLGIGSPSRVFAAVIGVPLAEGIGVGFTEKMADVIPEMVAVVEQIAPAMSGLATSMASQVAAVDQYRDALGASRQALVDVKDRLFALQQLKANTKPNTDARRAIEAEIQALQAQKRDLDEAVKAYRDMAEAASEGVSALDGWNDAIRNVAQGARDIEVFGKEGVKAIAALNAAFLDDTPKAGAAAVKAVMDAAEAARKAGVTNWRELGEAALAAYGRALEERTPEAIQAALNSTQEIWDAIKAKAEAEKPTIFSAVSSALDARQIAAEVGSSWASMFVEVGAAITAGKEIPVAAVGQFAASVLDTLQTLPDNLRGRLGTDFYSAMQAFMNNPTQEALATLQRTAGEINRTAQLIPDGFRRLAPQVQQYILQMVDAVNSGAIGIKDAQQNINDFTSLIPQNLRKLPPAVQTEIQNIVDLWKAGAISIEMAQDSINDAIQRGEDFAKKALDQTKRIADEIEAYRRYFQEHGTQGAAPATPPTGGGSGGGSGSGDFYGTGTASPQGYGQSGNVTCRHPYDVVIVGGIPVYCFELLGMPDPMRQAYDPGYLNSGQFRPQMHAEGGVFARRTPMWDMGGRMHVFGEKGPEPFGPPSTMRQMLGESGGGQPPVVVNLYGDTYGVDKLEQRIEDATRRAMARRI